jgi:hypothetical protein
LPALWLLMLFSGFALALTAGKSRRMKSVGTWRVEHHRDDADVVGAQVAHVPPLNGLWDFNIIKLFPPSSLMQRPNTLERSSLGKPPPVKSNVCGYGNQPENCSTWQAPDL